jgi:hypothetical protein
MAYRHRYAVCILSMQPSSGCEFATYAAYVPKLQMLPSGSRAVKSREP